MEEGCEIRDWEMKTSISKGGRAWGGVSSKPLYIDVFPLAREPPLHTTPPSLWWIRKKCMRTWVLSLQFFRRMRRLRNSPGGPFVSLLTAPHPPLSLTVIDGKFYLIKFSSLFAFVWLADGQLNCVGPLCIIKRRWSISTLTENCILIRY